MRIVSFIKEGQWPIVKRFDVSKLLIALVSSDGIEGAFVEGRRASNIPGLIFRIMLDGLVYAEMDSGVCPLLIAKLEDGTRLAREMAIAWMREALTDPEFPWTDGAKAFGEDFAAIAGPRPDFGEENDQPLNKPFDTGGKEEHAMAFNREEGE